MPNKLALADNRLTFLYVEYHKPLDVMDLELFLANSDCRSSRWLYRTSSAGTDSMKRRWARQ